MNLDSVRCRDVRRSDLDRVFAILQDISHYRPDESSVDAVWKAFDDQPHVHGIVAVWGRGSMEQIAGFGSLCVDLKIRGGAIGHVEDIVVASEFRRQGVGNLIVRALIDLARAKGCYKVSLECRDDKVPFYEQLGFAHTGCAMSMQLGKDSSASSSG